MSVTRRQAMLGAAIAAAAGPTLLTGADARANSKPVEAGHDMSSMPPDWVRQDQIALLIYPAMTALDMVAPQYAFASLMGATVHLVAKSRDPIVSDTGLSILPTSTFDECPRDLDVICVPGGPTGTLAAMQDDTTLSFLADRGSRAKFVTSVCTGSLVLGAAGLLRGYKATSHWATRELLVEFGAVSCDQRVVIDRNRLTGGGVTAGMDLGLTVVAKLRDEFYAQGVQLMAEYAPQPPFNAGTPATAPEAVFKIMDEMFIGFRAQATEVARRVVQQRTMQ